MVFINDQLVVEKILKHLDLLHSHAHSLPVSEETKIVEETMYDTVSLIIFPNSLPQ